MEERPISAQNRSRFGHWEADTVLGVAGGACLLIVEELKKYYGVGSPCRTICTVCGSPPCTTFPLLRLYFDGTQKPFRVGEKDCRQKSIVGERGDDNPA